MVMPDNELSSQLVLGEVIFPDNSDRPSPTTDYERGGIAISDPSEGLEYQVWTATYAPLTGVVTLTPADTGSPVEAFTLLNITELSLAFDQNMNVFLTYMVDNAQAWYFWYDPIAQTYLHQVMDSDVRNPRCCMDDKRLPMVDTSDIILTYTRGSLLYFRLQRDRYITEYTLNQMGTIPGRLENVGMARNHRLHWTFLTTPDSVVTPDPLNKLELLENAAEQGWIDLGAWDTPVIDFGTYFSQDEDGPDFTDVVACTALSIIDVNNASAQDIEIHIDDTVDCSEAMVLSVNTSGAVLGSLHYTGTALPASAFIPLQSTQHYLLIASDTGNVSITKVTPP